jgi:toxin ParE1/3/4
MARLVFSRDASADIADIMAFSVAQFGKAVAVDYLDGLEIACELLREYPEMAAVYPRVKPEMRCLTYRSHRIFYRVDGDEVLIVRVLHRARDAKRVLR